MCPHSFDDKFPPVPGDQDPLDQNTRKHPIDRMKRSTALDVLFMLAVIDPVLKDDN